MMEEEEEEGVSDEEKDIAAGFIRRRGFKVLLFGWVMRLENTHFLYLI